MRFNGTLFRLTRYSIATKYRMLNNGCIVTRLSPNAER